VAKSADKKGSAAADGISPDAPLVLVDGSSYLFRAFHALPSLTTSNGFPTGAIRGVIAMLRKLAKDYQGSPIAVVFDAKGSTFRNDMYEQYKANRPPMPDELREQIEPIHQIITAMGLPLLIVPEVEADDVIGTLATEATADQRETVISTGDKDMAQLVSDHVTLVNTMTDTRMDREGVLSKFGVTPEQIVDYLALMGDTVDNIPGVPSVGPKTAAKWLSEHQTLDAIIAAADSFKGKVGEKLRDSLEQLPLSRALTQIKCDVGLDLGIADLVPEPPAEETLREMFERFEFKAWLDELGGSTSQPKTQTGDYTCILDQTTLEDWISRLTAAGQFAVDTETTSISYMDAELVGFSFCVEAGVAAYLPVSHGYVGAPQQLSLSVALEHLKPLLEDPQLKKIGQNLKYDKSVLAKYGVELAGVSYDTMLESYVVNSVGSRHNMDDLAARYLDRQTIKFSDVAGKGAKQITFDQVPLEAATDYAAEDADVTLQLHEVLWPKLLESPSLLSVYQDIELPLMPVLSKVERTGTLIDGGLLGEQSRELALSMAELTEQAYVLAGGEFNLDSPKQLQEILYDRLGLPVLKKTPKGQPSTAEPVLQDLAIDYELPQIIMRYRSMAKLKSTYTDKLPLQINQKTGRVHTSYHQAVTATGRLSSSDPNLQNIPIRTAEGRRIRQAFVAPQGRRIVAADYSQIELRIMAHLSGDEGLMKAFAENQDIHRATAAEVFGSSLDTVSDEQRRNAKAINFGLIYGMSAFGLGKQLGISRTLAQDYIDRYFDRYPGVLAYMERTRELAREQGFVETVFGRRLYLPEINARQAPRRQAAERTAINAPMQGTAADIIKRAMIEVDSWLSDVSLDVLMIMQVHDELVFEVADADSDDLIAGVTERMNAAAELSVPLLVEVGVGANWDEAH
jgi:DNA polymerase-1